MPLFEYACRACGHQFEHLSRGDERPTCPSCAASDLEKQLSVFAVSTGSGSTGRSVDSTPEVAPCGACGDPRGPGACSVS